MSYALSILLLFLAALPLQAAQPALELAEVAPGLFVHAGRHEESTAANGGDIANIGFILGSRCVAVIDTGGSIAVGRALHAEIRRRTTLPVCYVINTHVHPDHIFGNAAFLAEQPVFVGHARLPAAMGARARNYLHALERDLGAAAQGSEAVAPTLLVRDRSELDLGERVLELRAWPTAHTDNDLTVFDRQTATLWVSDLLFVERIPVVDGSVKGWLAVLGQLKQLDVARWIPGHGPVQGRGSVAIAEEERYLGALVRETRVAIAGKRTLAQTVEEAGTQERNRWRLFDLYHRRNVTAVYAELEWE